MQVRTALIVGFLLAVANPAFSFDHLKAIDKCISDSVSEKMKADYVYVMRDERLGLKDELSDALAGIQRDVRDGLLSKAEASQFIQFEKANYIATLKVIEDTYKRSLEIIEASSDQAICIYKNFLRKDSYNKPSIISRAINGSPVKISKAIIKEYDSDRFIEALALKWWCERTNDSVCFFNY